MTTTTKKGAGTALKVTNKNLGEMLAANQQALENALQGAPLVLAEFVVALDTQLAQSEQLQQCMIDNPDSVRNAMLSCAMLGLRPGSTHKHFALVPFKVKGKMTCVGIVEWRGYVEVANQAGQLDSEIVCRIVYEHEVKPPKAKKGEEQMPVLFAYDQLTGQITHPLDLTGEHDALKTQDKAVAVYATCRVKGRQGFATVVLTKKEVEKARGRSASWTYWKRTGNGEEPAWETEWEAMWKKTAIRRLMESAKIPMTRNRLAQLRQAEEAAEETEEEILKDAVVTVRDAEPDGEVPPAEPDNDAEAPADNADDHRADLELRFDACIRKRSGGDAEKAAKIVEDIENAIFEKHGTDTIELLETPELERLVVELEKKANGKGGRKK